MENGSAGFSEDGLDERLVTQNAAIIAHQDTERILVVKIRGYDDWRVPYSDYREGEHAIETARRVLVERVCCDKVSHAVDLGEKVRIGFTPADRETWDSHATANFYMERDIHMYVADLSCDAHDMDKGRRVESFNLVRYDRIGNFLRGKELEIVEDILIDLKAGRIW